MGSPDIIVSEESGVRTLHFGSAWVQGAMRVARPFRLELAYTREMMLPLLLRNWLGGPPRVLVVGLGAGSMPKFLHRHCPDAHITVVEIEPAVHAIAVQQFRFPSEDNRLTVVYADAADFVGQTAMRFDCMLVDGFDPNARMGRLCTPDFFAQCAGLLTPGGVFCINLLTRRKEYGICRSYIEAAFQQPLLALPSMDRGNAVVLGSLTGVCEPGWIDAIEPQVSEFKRMTGTDLRASLKVWRAAGLNAHPACGVRSD